MQDLKNVIRAHLTNAQTVQGVLMDYGLDHRTVGIMVNLYNSGIVDKLCQCGKILPQDEVYKLISLQEKNFGTSRQFAEEGIRRWAELLDAMIEIPDRSEEKIHQNLNCSADMSTQIHFAYRTENTQCSPITTQKIESLGGHSADSQNTAKQGQKRFFPSQKVRSKQEQQVLFLGWAAILGCIFLWIASGMSKPLLLLLISTVLAQWRLWQRGFDLIASRPLLAFLYYVFGALFIRGMSLFGGVFVALMIVFSKSLAFGINDIIQGFCMCIVFWYHFFWNNGYTEALGR